MYSSRLLNKLFEKIENWQSFYYVRASKWQCLSPNRTSGTQQLTEAPTRVLVSLGHTSKLIHPFDIGIITKIIENNDKVQIKIRILYRPENTKFDWKKFVVKHETFELFWTEEFMTVDATRIEGNLT